MSSIRYNLPTHFSLSSSATTKKMATQTDCQHILFEIKMLFLKKEANN